MPNPILTKSNRAVGAPPEPEAPETYEVLDEQQTAFEAMKRLSDKAAEIDNSSLPQEDKDALIEDLQARHDRIIAQGDQPLEQPWMDPIDAVAGPAGFTKVASKTFGKLTRGVLTGTGRLSGKSAVKALSASLAAEVPTGQTLEILDETMPVDTPWYIQTPLSMVTGLAVGGISQSKIENGISAVAAGIRKQGIDVDASTVNDAVQGAQKLIDDELTLVSVVDQLPKKDVKRELLKPREEKIVPFKKEKKKTGKQIAKEYKESLPPL